MTQLVTRTKLARLVHHFTHLPKCSLRDRTTIPRSLFQFSTKTAANCGGEQSPERRRVELPKELSKHVIKLSCESTAEGGVCDVYVVGTIHFSKESTKQVEDIIKFLKPETVFLELCSSRQRILFLEKIKVPTIEDTIALLKKKQHNIFRILIGWLIAQHADKVDGCLVSEFRSGYREARKYGGRVVLGDRPIEITFKRAWRTLPLKHILRLLKPSSYPDSITSLSISDYVKQLDNDDSINSLKQMMSEMFPSVMETLLHERDQYMSHTLLKVASESRSVVAVVGRAHLQGIKKNWKQPIKIQDLITVPPPRRTIPVMRIFAYAGIVVAGVTIITNTYL